MTSSDTNNIKAFVVYSELTVFMSFLAYLLTSSNRDTYRLNPVASGLFRTSADRGVVACEGCLNSSAKRTMLSTAFEYKTSYLSS